MNAKELSNLGAYPNPRLNWELGAGLTKRELFAAMAMQGILAMPDRDQISFGEMASDAVRCANCLLAELAKEQTP